MTWVRLDDQFADHPKVAAAGPLAAWLYVCGLTYSARFLTDGHIPAVHLPRLAAVPQPAALAERLVAVGLWERAEGGYRVHDYLRYQPSAAEVRARLAADAARKAARRADVSERIPNRHRMESAPLPNGVRGESAPRARVVPPIPDTSPPLPLPDTSRTGGEGGAEPPLANPPVLRAGGDGDAIDADAARLWTAALDALASHMSRGNWEAYLRDTRGLALADGRLVVGVRNPLLLDVIEQRFGALVRRTLADLDGAPADVRLVAAP